MARHRPLLVVLALGLLLRLVLVVLTTGVGTPIVDEQHYTRLAQNLVDGNGFGWGPGRLTSIRPPAYPSFVAAVWYFAGSANLTAVRLAQIPFALVSIVLVYAIGFRLFDRKVALLAAAGAAFYPSLLFSGVLILSETLFTMLLLASVLGIVTLLERPSASTALVTGICLGAAALTRSVLWPFLPVLMLTGMFALRGPVVRRLAVLAALVLGFALVVGPWSVRNTRLNQTLVIVDTMGGLNLMMGNYEFTPEDRPWDAIALTGEQSWAARLPPTDPSGRIWTEGTKEGWAKQQAAAYMRQNPGRTLRRSVMKFADFWGIERDFIAGVQQGFYHPPLLIAAGAAAAMAGAYILTMLMGAVGACFAPPDRRAHLFLLLLVAFVCGVHTIVFGHARYHLPLMPLFALYAAAGWYAAPWRQLLRARIRTLGLAAVTVLLVGIWTRELFVRDADRLVRFASSVIARN